MDQRAVEDLIVELLAAEEGVSLAVLRQRVAEADGKLSTESLLAAQVVVRVVERYGAAWYAGTLASKLGLDLDDIARADLEQTRERWLRTNSGSFDDHHPDDERLPRRGRFDFTTSTSDTGRPTVRVRHDGQWMGDPLTDASHVDDGYRFHDVFHLGYAAALGWSPVIRKLLGRKRRSSAETDAAEDGERAIVTEEGIAVMVFAYATSHNYLRGVTRLDFQLLDVIKKLAAPFEVGGRTAADWEHAILTSFAAWRQLRDEDGGAVSLDAANRGLTVMDTPAI